MKILSLETSTSSVKAMLYHEEQLHVHTLPYPRQISDGKTIDPYGAYRLLLQCAGTLLADTGLTPDMVCLAAVWHGLLLADRHMQPLGPYFTWAHTSPGENQIEAMSKSFQRGVFQKTGCPPHSSFTFWKLLDARRQEAAYVITLGEYLFYQMTNQKRITLTSASGTGLLNIHQLTWDKPILEVCGIHESQLFEPVEPGYAAPMAKTAATALGLRPGTPVTAAMPDGALNHLAAGGMGDDMITLSVGTSGALRLSTQQPVISSGGACWCYYLAEGRWLTGCATSGAGNCVQLFRDQYLPGASGGDLERLLTTANREQAPCFLPFPFGERSPGWRDKRPWGWRGGNQTSVAIRYYSVLEGVLMNLRQCLMALTEATGVQRPYVDLSGGILYSPGWTQMAADILGLPMTPNPSVHASSYGAILVGMKALGMIASFREAAVSNTLAVRPDEEKSSFYQMRYQKYLTYYMEE